jgi:transposase
LALLSSRDALVGARTKLVNHVRGAVKSFGARLPKCTTEGFHNRVAEHLPQELVPALEPVLETIASLSERIRYYDRKLEGVAEEIYPETKLLRQVHGVGVL